jgi:hypothetical protein
MTASLEADLDSAPRCRWLAFRQPFRPGRPLCFARSVLELPVTVRSGLAGCSLNIWERVTAAGCLASPFAQAAQDRLTPIPASRSARPAGSAQAARSPPAFRPSQAVSSE